MSRNVGSQLPTQRNIPEEEPKCYTVPQKQTAIIKMGAPDKHTHTHHTHTNTHTTHTHTHHIHTPTHHTHTYIHTHPHIHTHTHTHIHKHTPTVYTFLYTTTNLNSEDETEGLSRNVGKKLPPLAALCPRTAHLLSTSRRKPEITQVTPCSLVGYRYSWRK